MFDVQKAFNSGVHVWVLDPNNKQPLEAYLCGYYGWKQAYLCRFVDPEKIYRLECKENDIYPTFEEALLAASVLGV